MAFVPALLRLSPPLLALVLGASCAPPAPPDMVQRPISDNSCRWAFDGACDYPGIGTGACAKGTDAADCEAPRPSPIAGGGSPLAGGDPRNSCRWAFDGACDHPRTGTGACAPGTDVTDCSRPAAAPGRGGLRPLASGSGFFVNGDGYLVTNAHVVEDCAVTAILVGGEVEAAPVSAIDRGSDLAILRAARTPGRAAALRSGGEPLLGQTVYAFGFPLFGTLRSINMSNGIVSSLTGYRGDPDQFQTTAPIQQGNSGGPLLDDSGAVVGVVNALISNAQNVGFAVKGRTLADFLDSRGVRFRPAPPGGALQATQVAANATDFTVPVLCLGR